VLAKRVDTGFIQTARVIVDVLREQAGSHERLANKFAPTLQVRATPIQSRSGSGSGSGSVLSRLSMVLSLSG